MNESIYVSREGLARLRADLERAELAYRTACEESAIACALSGDGWHDNPYFNQSQQYEAALSREVMRLRHLLARAVLHDEAPLTHSPERVQIGVFVCLSVFDRRTQGETEQHWQIVGYGEGRKDAGKLAYNAPLAAVIMGRREGAVIEARIADREVDIEIVEIRASRP